MLSRCLRNPSGSEYTRAGSVRATLMSGSMSNAMPRDASPARIDDVGRYDGRVLTSALGLALPLRVAAGLTYAGAFAFVLKRVAAVERPHFVDGAAAPRRLVVV